MNKSYQSSFKIDYRWDLNNLENKTADQSIKINNTPNLFN